MPTIIYPKEAKDVTTLAAMLKGDTRKLRHGLVRIGPEEALECFRRSPNEQRRSLRASHVNKMADDILAGRWHLTLDPLRFDKKGIFRDGHNRCAAIIQADTPVTTNVVVGMSDDSLKAVDRGKARTLADVFKMGGHTTKRHPDLAASVSALWRILRGSSCTKSSAIPGHDEAIKMLEEWPEIHNAVDTFAIRDYRLVGGNVAESAALYCIFSRIDGKLADSFAETLVYGEGLTRGHPIYLLRRKLNELTNTKSGNPGVKRWRRAAYIITAWNLLMRDVTQRTKLQLPEGRRVPSIHGWKTLPIPWTPDTINRRVIPDFDETLFGKGCEWNRIETRSATEH